MSRLFNRKWRVTVGTLQSEDIDIKFSIKRTLQSTPGTCDLELYNLSESHRGEIKDATNPIVRIEAGYEDTGLSMLFQGNERRTFSYRDDADIVTKITAGDGENAIRTARAARAFGPNTQLADVIRYLGDQMGVGTGNIGEALQNATLDQLTDVFPHGSVVRGLAAQELTQLLRSANLEWSIQEGVLQVLPRGNALQREAIRLASDTGMLESPEVGKANVVTVKSLLIPDLVPGRLVQIDSDAIRGTYRIESATYEGESRNGDWTVTLETKERT